MTSDGDVTTDIRDVEAYGTGRAARRRAALFAGIADIALAATPIPLRVLDIGCRDGRLVRELVERLPNVYEICGVDPSERMVRIARAYTEGVPRFQQGRPEELPFAERHFDLVLSAMSFRHWDDRVRGLAEVRRVLAPGGVFVLADAKAGRRAAGALERAGLKVRRRDTVQRRFGVLTPIRAFTVSG
jgi:SAM-dependent methyltransferase